MHSLIKMQGLGKRYSLFDHWVLHRVDLEIFPGKYLDWRERKGPGKTTLARLVLGLLHPSRGEISIRKNIRRGYVPEENSFSHHRFKIHDYLLRAGRVSGLSGKKLKRKVNEALELVNLQVSGGEQIGVLTKWMLKRFYIALAVVDRPDLLVLDETAEGLDAAEREELWKLVSFLNRQGATVLLTSSVPEELETVCHRLGFLHEGEVVLDPDGQESLRQGERGSRPPEGRPASDGEVFF